MELYKKTSEIYDTVYQDLTDQKFWLTMAHRHGAPVLELGCGTGRIALELARAGFDVSGLDNSSEMLAVIKRKSRDLPKDAHLEIVQGDMTNFSLPRMFRMVTIPFSAFQHLLTTREQEACLRAAAKHLMPGGVLVIDVFNPDLKRPQGVLHHQFTGKDKDGRTISKFGSFTYNPTTQISRQHFFIDISEKDSKHRRITEEFRLRYVFQKDLKKLLESNGFRVTEVYGDYRMNRFSEKESRRIIMLATKG